MEAVDLGVILLAIASAEACLIFALRKIKLIKCFGCECQQKLVTDDERQAANLEIDRTIEAIVDRNKEVEKRYAKPKGFLVPDIQTSSVRRSHSDNIL